jgi:SPW repeat.
MGRLVQLAAGNLAMHLTLGSAIRSGLNFDTNRRILGVLIILAELVTLSVYRAWEEWVSVILGAWLIICSWILGISSSAARATFVVVGLLVIALAFYEIWEARRQSSNQN